MSQLIKPLRSFTYKAYKAVASFVLKHLPYNLPNFDIFSKDHRSDEKVCIVSLADVGVRLSLPARLSENRIAANLTPPDMTLKHPRKAVAPSIS